MGLEGMDTLAVCRGIISAGMERFSFGQHEVEVRLPLGLIMAAADEIARHRDQRKALGLPPLDGTIPVRGTPAGQAPHSEAPDRRSGA